MPTIVLITGHFSNSTKFRGNVKIPRLSLKFRGPQKTVGPIRDQELIEEAVEWFKGIHICKLTMNMVSYLII